MNDLLVDNHRFNAPGQVFFPPSHVLHESSMSEHQSMMDESTIRININKLLMCMYTREKDIRIKVSTRSDLEIRRSQFSPRYTVEIRYSATEVECVRMSVDFVCRRGTVGLLTLASHHLSDDVGPLFDVGCYDFFCCILCFL